MGFILIDNMEYDALELDTWIKKTRNNTKDEKITPKFALEILSKTNHSGHIKTILFNIGEKCASIKERLEYKEFVLSAVEGRLHTKTVADYLKELAEEGGYLEEFKTADAKEKVYSPQQFATKYFVFMDKNKHSMLETDATIRKMGLDVTPESAMKILKQTNHYAHIKKLISIIEANNGGEEYKDFMLSCVCGRETSQSSYEMIKNWCEKHNCVEELEQANSLGKVYDRDGNVISGKTKDEIIRDLKSMSATQLFK